MSFTGEEGLHALILCQSVAALDAVVLASALLPCWLEVGGQDRARGLHASQERGSSTALGPWGPGASGSSCCGLVGHVLCLWLAACGRVVGAS